MLIWLCGILLQRDRHERVPPSCIVSIRAIMSNVDILDAKGNLGVWSHTKVIAEEILIKETIKSGELGDALSRLLLSYFSVGTPENMEGMIIASLKQGVDALVKRTKSALHVWKNSVWNVGLLMLSQGFASLLNEWISRGELIHGSRCHSDLYKHDDFCCAIDYKNRGDSGHWRGSADQTATTPSPQNNNAQFLSVWEGCLKEVARKKRCVVLGI